MIAQALDPSGQSRLIIQISGVIESINVDQSAACSLKFAVCNISLNLPGLVHITCISNEQDESIQMKLLVRSMRDRLLNTQLLLLRSYCSSVVPLHWLNQCIM